MNIRGIDHVGLTVPNIEQATIFFEEAFNAIKLYDILEKEEKDKNSIEVQKRLGIPETMSQVAIRMLKFPNGPQIELFEYAGPDQLGPIKASDLGWQHVAFYVEDINRAIVDIEKAGGKRLADPKPLGGLEAGEGNHFCYLLTPWQSTIEILTYPDRQPYEDYTSFKKWQV